MSSDTPRESLTLSIPTQLDALLAQRAVQAGKSKAEIVELALVEYLAPQTPVERSLQTLEQNLNQRLGKLETYLLRLQPPIQSPRFLGAIDTESEDPDDEADEVLPEFLEFASPEIQGLAH